MKCPECKEGLIEEDSQCGRVCTSCGYVFEEEMFATDCQMEGTSTVKQSGQYAHYYSSSLPRYLLSHNKPSVSKRITSGKELISYIASYLHLSSVTREEIEMFFTETVAKCSKSAVFPRKRPLIACCTYVVLRRKNFPIVISKICNFFQITSTAFNKTYRVVKKIGKVTVSTSAVDELVPSVLKTVNFQDEVSNIIPIAQSILRVVRDCWITCGRIPQPLIIAAGYIAWKSLSCKRRNCSFPAFCEKLHVKEHRSTASQRVNDICHALIKLGERLPWCEKGKRGEIKKKDIPYMLDSILNHSKMLTAPQTGDNGQLDAIKEFKTFRTIKEKAKHKLHDDDDTYSEEFDDSSLDCYLRTEEEVRVLEKFLNEKSEFNKTNDV